jgi:hypothetical protein
MDASLSSAIVHLPSFFVTNWLVLVGVLALFYYGRHRFNTPDYALSPQQ